MEEKSKMTTQLKQIQQVDPVVSRQKFDRELSDFQKLEAFNRKRGVFLQYAKFPEIIISFATYRIRPLAFAFTVKLDFTNYDLEPPSLTFIDPITWEKLRHELLNIQLFRQVPNQLLPAEMPNNVIVPPQDMIQSHAPDHIPFLCLPGIKEYHKHPVHSNDPWLAHRGKGEGTLGFIVDQLHKYGTEPINGLTPNVFNINVRKATPAGVMLQFQGCTFTVDKIPT